MGRGLRDEIGDRARVSVSFFFGDGVGLEVKVERSKPSPERALRILVDRGLKGTVPLELRVRDEVELRVSGGVLRGCWAKGLGGM